MGNEETTPEANARDGGSATGMQLAVGCAAALTASICWAGNFIAGRGLADLVPPMTLVILRGVLGVLFLLPFAARQLRRDWPQVVAHWRYFALSGFLGLTVPYSTIYMAAHSTNALNMSIIAITTPLFMLLLARIVYSEHLTYMRLAGLGVVICGILVLISKGDIAVLAGLRFAPGDLLMLVNAMCFASYTVLLRKSPKIGGLSFLAVFMFAGTLFTLPGAVWEIASGGRIFFTAKFVGGLLYVVIGATLVAIGCWNLAIQKIGLAKSSILYYTLPLFSGLGGMIFLDEPVLTVHFISMALVITGLLIALRAGEPKQ